MLKGKVGDGPNIRLTAARGTVAVRKPGDTDTETDTDDTPDSKPPQPPKPPKPPAPPKTQIKL